MYETIKIKELMAEEHWNETAMGIPHTVTPIHICSMWRDNVGMYYVIQYHAQAFTWICTVKGMWTIKDIYLMHQQLQYLEE